MALPRERQTTIFDRMRTLARRAEGMDPRTPALHLFLVTLALSAFGLLIQASHAATVGSPEVLEGELSVLHKEREKNGGDASELRAQESALAVQVEDALDEAEEADE